MSDAIVMRTSMVPPVEKTCVRLCRERDDEMQALRRDPTGEDIQWPMHHSRIRPPCSADLALDGRHRVGADSTHVALDGGPRAHVREELRRGHLAVNRHRRKRHALEWKWQLAITRLDVPALRRPVAPDRLRVESQENRVDVRG